jgi:hypothetical protein
MWLEQENDNLLPSSAKKKNIQSYTSTPLNIFMAWCLIKQSGNLLYFNLIFLSITYWHNIFLYHKFFKVSSGMIVDYVRPVGDIMLSLSFQCHITILSFVL